MSKEQGDIDYIQYSRTNGTKCVLGKARQKEKLKVWSGYKSDSNWISTEVTVGSRERLRLSETEYKTGKERKKWLGKKHHNRSYDADVPKTEGR